MRQRHLLDYPVPTHFAAAPTVPEGFYHRASMAERRPLVLCAMCGVTLSARISATNEAPS
jgi:hypothetical protein